ncbi:MAG: SPOR domain-containing protein [Desulfobacterales bacterium]|nr:SPOR domain-containing protein [Desulfobacterales bacterium]
MAHTLKHIAFRIWGTVLLGGLAGLWILPTIDFGLSPAWAPVPAAVLMVTVFLLLGWLFNRLALFLVDRHIEEASTWESVGSNDAAGTAYEKALAVFDSFLISPRVKQLEASRLTSRLSRFYLARADKQPYSEMFIAFYLNTHPDDHAVAESWLRQARAADGLETRYHDTAARIGEALAQNRTIQQLLARLYLSDNRTDFPALQTYRRATGGRGRAARSIAGQVARLFLKDGRADEWALQLYLQAGVEEKPGQELLNGIAACVHWIPETSRNKRLLEIGRQHLGSIDREQLALMRTGFTPPKPPEPAVTRPGVMAMLSPVGRLIHSGLDGLGNLFIRGVRSGLALFRKFFRRVGRSPLTRPVLNWTAVTLLSVVVVVLIINTVRHLAQMRPPEKTAATAVDKIVTDKFTLQVAAYLKKKHAEKYTTELKAQGIEAYWIETTRRNKRWYQVRVAHFPNKAAARAFGLSLKKKGLIDDFYVANYDPG